MKIIKSSIAALSIYSGVLLSAHSNTAYGGNVGSIESSQIEADNLFMNSLKTSEIEMSSAGIYTNAEHTQSIVVRGRGLIGAKQEAGKVHNGVYYAVEIFKKSIGHSKNNPQFLIGMGYDYFKEEKEDAGIYEIEMHLSFPLNTKEVPNTKWKRQASYFLGQEHREVHEISWKHLETDIEFVAQGRADKDNISFVYLRDKNHNALAVDETMQKKLLGDSSLPRELKSLLKILK